MLWQSAGLLRLRPLPWRCIPIPWERQVLRLSCGPQCQWIGMFCSYWALWLRRIALQRDVTFHTLAAVCFRGCPSVECPLSSLSTSSSGWYSTSLSAVCKHATGPILVSETCRRSLGIICIVLVSVQKGFHLESYKILQAEASLEERETFWEP